MNFYEVLGVARDADRAEIRAAYRRLSGEYHPDVNDHPRADDQFSVLTRAEDVLTDPEERAAYDRLGHRAYVEDRYPGGLPDVGFDHVDGGATGQAASGPAGGTRSDRSEETTGGATSGRRRRRGRRRRSRGASQGDPAWSYPEEGTGGRADGAAGTAGGGTGTDASADSGGSPSTSSTPGRRRTPGVDGALAWARGVGTALRQHLTVSARWLAVAAAAAVYGAGLPAYLRAGDEGVGRLLAAVAAADTMRVAGAAGDVGYDLPGVVAFTRETGIRAGVVPTDAALLLAGVILLPLATTGAVVGLRRRGTWRPNPLYAAGSYGPAAAVALDGAVTRGWAPVETVPLAAELTLLVALPALSVVPFLLARLVLAAPVRPRDGGGR